MRNRNINLLVLILLCTSVESFKTQEKLAISSQDEIVQTFQIDKFRKPIEGGSVVCVFDTKKCADTTKHHTGVDYWGNGKKATDIYASNCGTVSYIQLNDGKDHGLGNTVILRHSASNDGGNNFFDVYTLYAHMASIDPGLKLGQKMTRSARLGVMGSTGKGQTQRWGKTPHLHFEVKGGNTMSNSAGYGSFWGYTPFSAFGYGYVDPADIIDNWIASCAQKFIVKAYNIDDRATVYVNGRQIVQIRYKATNEIDISRFLNIGENQVRFVLENFQEGFTYGFEIYRDDTSIFKDECGIAGSLGCRMSSRLGKVYDRTITVKVEN